MKSFCNQLCGFVVKLLYLSFLAILNCSISVSQNYYFDNYNVKEGLAQSSVYDVIQDSKGYFWIGTAAGLSRFDGIHFKHYTQETGLAKDGVQRILQDSHGNLWFGHKSGGLSRLKDDSLQFIQPDTVNADITSIVEDNEGNLWIGTHGAGAFKLTNPNVNSLKSLDFIQYKGGNNELSDLVFSILKTQDGILYFIIDSEIKYFDTKENSFKKYKPKNLSQFYQFTCLFEDHNGDLWFGTVNGGLYRSNKDGSYSIFTEKEGLAHNLISYIKEDKYNNIWIGTWGGGISLIQNNVITNFNLENGLPDIKIRCIKEDSEGNILIGTYDNGLCVFKGKLFVNYSEKDGIKGNQVWAILEDKDGKFWLGTNNGITVFAHSNASFTNPLYYNEEDGKLPGNHIRFLKEDKTGNIWIGTENTGVLQYNKKTKTFDYNFLINANIQQNNMVTSMEIDNNNNLWIGTINGLINYEIYTDKVAVITIKYGIAGDDISALYADSNNQLWIGSVRNGLTIFNDKDTSFTVIKNEFIFTPTCITESTDKKIWVGTQANGVMVFDGTKLIKQYRISEGLLTDYITSIQSGINGDVYIGTSRGLNKYNHQKSRISAYSDKTGFEGIEVKKNASFKDKDGNIWFGTVKGITRVDISSTIDNNLEPITFISRLRVNLKDTKLIPELLLNYTENSVIFDYTSISLTDPQAIVYKIMLQGADKDWRPETNQTIASYSSLQPGKYVFKVIAKNSSGIWNSEPVSYSFTIAPPFYKSIWFYFFITISGFSLFILFIKIRERNLIKEKEMLAKKVEERTIEISKKNKELELKNKNITDSIKYAKRIQDAMLPDFDYLKQILADFFILYKPRDIVSGDYYWATKKGEHLIFAAADCTGHGVPGAFMSMLGITLLDEIVNKKNIFDADLILDQMREAVIKSLKQKGIRGETQDGMDLALCSINTKNLIMQYSGAYNPLYLLREGELIRFKANRMPIGIYYKKTSGFLSHSIQLKKNDKIYLFSDGYLDQFSDKSGEKIMVKNFKKYLLESCHLSLEDQKNFLENRLQDWQGTAEQVDDILIFAVKVDF